MKCIWNFRFLRTKMKCLKEHLNAPSKEYDPEIAGKTMGLFVTKTYQRVWTKPKLRLVQPHTEFSMQTVRRQLKREWSFTFCANSTSAINNHLGTLYAEECIQTTLCSASVGSLLHEVIQTLSEFKPLFLSWNRSTWTSSGWEIQDLLLWH